MTIISTCYYTLTLHPKYFSSVSRLISPVIKRGANLRLLIPVLIFLWNTLGIFILIEFVCATYLYYWRGWKNIYCFICHLSKRKEKQRMTEIKEYVEETRAISQVPKIPISCQNKPLSFVSICIRPKLYWAAHLRFRTLSLHWSTLAGEGISTF